MKIARSDNLIAAEREAVSTRIADWENANNV